MAAPAIKSNAAKVTRGKNTGGGEGEKKEETGWKSAKNGGKNKTESGCSVGENKTRPIGRADHSWVKTKKKEGEDKGKRGKRVGKGLSSIAHLHQQPPSFTSTTKLTLDLLQNVKLTFTCMSRLLYSQTGRMVARRYRYAISTRR